MKAELILPIECLRGTLRHDGYYFRTYKGVQIVQRCPNRKGYVAKPMEKAGQQLFAKRNRIVIDLIKGGSPLSRKELWDLLKENNIE